ncbi:WD repeat-containing protein 82 [Dictyocoela muelleri]|nr:WD repeat-containing protein 82 [Dictyocoela muelleri]
MNLSTETITGFKRFKIIDDKKISQIEYLHTGDKLVYKTPETLKIYDPLKGTLLNVIHLKILSFKMLFNNNLVHSTPTEVKYLSIYDNQYIRSFYGHQNVTEINKCPVNDLFITHSDVALFVWDLRYKKPIFRKNVYNSHSAFSKNNLTLLINNSILKTFDFRNLDSGPISSRIVPEKIDNINYIGENIIAGSKQSIIIFNDQYTKIFVEKRGNFCVTPDNNYIFCNSGNHLVAVFDALNGKNVGSYRGDSLVAFNPQYAQFVTAGNNLTFWMCE